MEIGSIFIIGLISTFISEIPDKYFERLPRQVAAFVPLILRYAGFAAMIGDFSISYLHNESTLAVYLPIVIGLAAIWLWRSVNDIRSLDKHIQKYTYATAGSLFSNLFILIGFTVVLGIIAK